MARDRGTQSGRESRGLKPQDVKVDIVDGPSVDIARDGPRAVRIARIFGAKGSPAARLWLALSAPAVPKYGDLHPEIDGLPVGHIHAIFEEGSTDIVTITIEYFYYTGGPAYFTNIPGDTVATLPQIEILSTVQPATTQFELLPDGTKKQIVVAYLVPPPEGEPGPPARIEQAGSVEYMLPMETVRYTRREPNDPQAKARLYVGRINSTNVFGDAPHMWLCSHLGGPSDDGGVSYNVTYDFQKNPDSWDPTVVPTDPETGQPRVLSDDDIASGEAVRQVRVLPEADFWDLNLTVAETP